MNRCHFELYRDGIREHRWRFIAANGEILADSSEGYRRKRDCVRGLELVKAWASDAKVTVKK